MMNLAHLHLLLNHFPIIGMMVGFALFLFSFVGNNTDLRRASYIIFAGVALLSIPTFMTGYVADALIRGSQGVSDALIDRHKGSAMLSFWFMEFTGAFALIGLWQAQKTSRPSNSNIAAVLILSLL